MRTPIRKEPVTLTTSVPIGKRPPHLDMIQVPMTKRASPPNPAPASTTRYLSKSVHSFCLICVYLCSSGPRELAADRRRLTQIRPDCERSGTARRRAHRQFALKPDRAVELFGG